MPPSLSAGLPGTTQVIDYGTRLTLNCASNSIAISWYWFLNGTRSAYENFSMPIQVLVIKAHFTSILSTISTNKSLSSLILTLSLSPPLRLVGVNGPQLNIASAVEEDSGSHQCYASNEAGTVGSATYVQVRSK